MAAELKNIRDAVTKTTDGWFPFLEIQCRICKSPSTGVHYGAPTCEGCKGFFKRSIPKHEDYRCYFGGTCDIRKETRNRCKSCRYKRCVQAGMALEAVKMGRIPKGEKAKAVAMLKAQGLKLPENRPKKTGNRKKRPSDEDEGDKQNTLHPDITPIVLESPCNALAPSQLNFLPPSERQGDCRNLVSAPQFQVGAPLMHPLRFPVNPYHYATTQNPDWYAGNLAIRSLPLPNMPTCVRPTRVQESIATPTPSAPSDRDLPEYQLTELQPLQNFARPNYNPVPRWLSLSNFSPPPESQPSQQTPARGNTVNRMQWPGDTSSLRQFPGKRPHSPVCHQGSPRTPSLEDSGFESRPQSRQNSCLSEPVTVGFDESASVKATEVTPQPSQTSSATKLKVVNFDVLLASLVKKSLQEIYLDITPRQRLSVMDFAIEGIDRAGTNVYQKRTTDQVDLMVDLWKDGRLDPKRQVDHPEMTILKIRDYLKLDLAKIVASIASFATQIPGAQFLDKADFRLLLEQCVYEMWMLQNAAFLINNESYVFFESSETQVWYNRRWMSQFLPEIMIDSQMKFADEMNPCQFSFLELNLLKVIVIVCPERVGLKSPDPIRCLRQIYLDALYHNFRLRGPGAAEEMMGKVAFLMPKLADLNELHKKCIVPIDLDKDKDWKVNEVS